MQTPTRTFRLAWLLSTTMAMAACSGRNDSPIAQDASAPDGNGGSDNGNVGGSTSGGSSSGGSSSGGSSSGGSSSGGSSSGGSSSGGSVHVTPHFEPPCVLTLTAAGEEIGAGVTCTDEDPALCFLECGPQDIGWKSVACTGESYAEGDCLFPNGIDDTSCYDVPSELSADCPTSAEAMPQAGEECAVPECTPCNVNNQYSTSEGSLKVGYCFCEAPFEGGPRTWLCGSAHAWP